MEGKIDLHVHTNYSDGSSSPRKVIEKSVNLNLAAISITDHDTTDGITEGIKWASKFGIEVVPGVELSAEGLNNIGEEIHILGYYINWENAYFQEKLKFFRVARERRARHILDKLYHIGIKLSEDRLFQLAGVGSIGRMHIARLMVDEGYVKTTQEAFDKYLVYGRPAFVPRYRLTSEEAIMLIKKIGGIPVLAHPKFGANRKKIVKYLVSKGLRGIEVYYERHTSQEVEKYLEWAKEFKLIPTGGSDSHGSLEDGTEDVLGKVEIEYKVLRELKKEKRKLFLKNINIFQE